MHGAHGMSPLSAANTPIAQNRAQQTIKKELALNIFRFITLLQKKPTVCSWPNAAGPYDIKTNSKVAYPA
jgi:phage portal protein BeeE